VYFVLLPSSNPARAIVLFYLVLEERFSLPREVLKIPTSGSSLE
jgi:hypothetical protein